MTRSECPCAVSTSNTSTLAFTSSSARSMKSPVTPSAAPTRSLPCSSFAACGYLMRFWMSLTVMSPFRRNASSTTRSFSTRCLCRIFPASSSAVPTGTVIRFSRVITCSTGRSVRDSKRKSRLVRIPTSLPFEVTGTPEILKRRMISRASEIRASGLMVTGSTIMPLSDRFTLSISSACRSIGRVR